MKFKVRKIQNEDYKIVAKMHEKTFKCIGQTREDLEKSLIEHPTWVAIFRNNIVGYIQASNKNGNVYCTWLAVDKRSRQHGVGKKLLRVLIAYAKKTETKRIKLETRNRFKEAIYFYLGNNFDIKSTRVGGDGDIMILLEYNLKK